MILKLSLTVLLLYYLAVLWKYYRQDIAGIFGCNLQIFLCLFLEKLNMPQNTPVTKAS